MNYERLILESLYGDTPKAKYDHLMSIQMSLVKLCYPRRGTGDENIDPFALAEEIMPHFHQHITVVDNPTLNFKP